MGDPELTRLERSAAAIRHALRPYVPVGTALVCRPINAFQGDVFRSESVAVQNAVPRRQAEFKAGRVACREAFAELGYPAMAIPTGPDRSPIWPIDVVGTITHAGGICAALVGPTKRYVGLGVDLEPDTPLDLELIELVLTPDDRRSLASLVTRKEEELELAKLIFVIKESAFKAQYSCTHRLLDFHDVTVTLQPISQEYVATVPPSEHHRIACQLAGHWISAGGFYAAVTSIRSDRR